MKQKTKDAIKDTAASARSVVIEQPKTFSVALEIAGTSELIMNRFSQKALEQMLRKHMGLSTQKEAKKPREVIAAATVRNTDGRECVASTAIKKAMLTASTAMKQLKKTQLRTQIFVEGNSIPITFSAMIPRMDMVRTAGIGRTPDIRFRPSFENWRARVIISFSDVLAVQTVVDLLNRAGSVGLGEWRPEKDGTYGQFRVVRNITDRKELDEVRRECAAPLEQLRIPEWAMDAEIDPELLRKVAGGGQLDAEPDEEGGDAESEQETGT